MKNSIPVIMIYRLLIAVSMDVGIGYKPLYGVGRVQIPYTKKIFMFNSITFRASKYTRSTGLNGFATSIGLSFRL